MDLPTRRALDAINRRFYAAAAQEFSETRSHPWPGWERVLGHLEVADRVTITAKSLVTHSIREAGEYSSGTPLQDNRAWRKNAARFKHLDEYARRLSALEKDSNDE